MVEKKEIIVIKYGGSILDGDSSIFDNLIRLKNLGIKTILIHGGGKEISKELDKNNIKTKFIQGLRVTDKKTIEIVRDVFQKINRSIVLKFGKDIKVKGLSGKEIILAEKMNDNLGFVGKIKKVDVRRIKRLLEENSILVISPLGKDKKGRIYNINADTFASSIASSMSVEKFIILTDVDGVYKKYGDKNSLLRELSPGQIKKLIKDGDITKGMIPKLESCLECCRAGVKECYILNGNRKGILLNLFEKKEFNGTLIKRRK